MLGLKHSAWVWIKSRRQVPGAGWAGAAGWSVPEQGRGFPASLPRSPSTLRPAGHANLSPSWDFN